MRTIEANDLIMRLLDLPGEIQEAEERLLERETDRRFAADLLSDESDRLLLSGQIDGKNTEQRSAQLRQALVARQADLDKAERLVASTKAQLHRLQAEHSSLRAVVRMIAAASD